MIQQTAGKSESSRTAGMHPGRRFGEVVVGMPADEELTWFFNDSGTEIRQPSSLAAASMRRNPFGMDGVMERADAFHAASKIWDRLQRIEPRESRVLETLYTDRIWPGRLVRRFGPVVGVVEGLVCVRAEHLGARMQGRTAAKTTCAWLEELVGRCSKDVALWRLEALRASEQALGACERARGDGPSVVPQDALR